MIFDEFKRQVYERYASGESLASIQRDLNINKDLLHRIILLGFESARSRKKPMPKATKDKILSMFKSGYSIAKICSELNLGRYTVSDCIVLEYGTDEIKRAREIRDGNKETAKQKGKRK